MLSGRDRPTRPRLNETIDESNWESAISAIDVRMDPLAIGGETTGSTRPDPAVGRPEFIAPQRPSTA